MNLYLRLIWLVCLSKFREKIDFLNGKSVLNMRVLPNDLDINMHMNNGRYLTIMDLGRVDLLMRSGMFYKIRKRGWMAVLGSTTIRYRRPLAPLQKFTLETSLTGWNDKWFYLEQKFIITSGKKKGDIAAYAIVKGAFLNPDIGKAEQVEDVMQAIGYTGESPALPEHIKSYIRSENALRSQSKNTTASSAKPLSNSPKPPRP